MVRGLEKFREFFADYQDSYLLIGGAACELWLEHAELAFRATKDLDIVLLLAPLNRKFVVRFNDFVKQGKYENRQASTGKRQYFRFFDPQEDTFPP